MSYLQRLEEEVDTRHVIHDAVATIFAAFDQRLDDIEAEKLEAPLATELAMAKLHKLINLATMPYDGVTHPDEVFERMTPDGEPYPDKIDSWARGIGKPLPRSRPAAALCLMRCLRRLRQSRRGRSSSRRSTSTRGRSAPARAHPASPATARP